MYGFGLTHIRIITVRNYRTFNGVNRLRVSAQFKTNFVFRCRKQVAPFIFMANRTLLIESVHFETFCRNLWSSFFVWLATLATLRDHFWPQCQVRNVRQWFGLSAPSRHANDIAKRWRRIDCLVPRRLYTSTKYWPRSRELQMRRPRQQIAVIFMEFPEILRLHHILMHTYRILMHTYRILMHDILAKTRPHCSKTWIKQSIAIPFFSSTISLSGNYLVDNLLSTWSLSLAG